MKKLTKEELRLLKGGLGTTMPSDSDTNDVSNGVGCVVFGGSCKTGCRVGCLNGCKTGAKYGIRHKK